MSKALKITIHPPARERGVPCLEAEIQAPNSSVEHMREQAYMAEGDFGAELRRVSTRLELRDSKQIIMAALRTDAKVHPRGNDAIEVDLTADQLVTLLAEKGFMPLNIADEIKTKALEAHPHQEAANDEIYRRSQQGQNRS